MDIKLKFVLGNDLPIKDIVSSDPYIKFKASGKKYKTKVYPNTCHPRWKESFDIHVAVNEEITFKLFDRDVIGKDDKMGVCKWVVPLLPLDRKEYFLLPNSDGGYIVIRAICKAGGYKQEIKPYANVQDRMILKLKIDKAEGFGVHTSNNGINGTVVKGFWKTRFGEYSAGMTKTTNTNYNLATVDKHRSFIIDTLVNDDIEFSLCCVTGKSRTLVGKGTYRVPDLHEDEEIKFHMELKPYGQIIMSMKCKKSIWRDVAPEAIPPKIDLMQGPHFPVSVTIHTVGHNPTLFLPMRIGAPYVQLKYGETKWKTGVCYKYRVGDNNWARPNMWNQSFLIFASVGAEVKVKLKTIDQAITGKFTKKETQGEGVFRWPEELMNANKSGEIAVPLTKGSGSVIITISRIRELSVWFRRYYLKEQI